MVRWLSRRVIRDSGLGLGFFFDDRSECDVVERSDCCVRLSSSPLSAPTPAPVPPPTFFATTIFMVFCCFLLRGPIPRPFPTFTPWGNHSYLSPRCPRLVVTLLRCGQFVTHETIHRSPFSCWSFVRRKADKGFDQSPPSA